MKSILRIILLTIFAANASAQYTVQTDSSAVLKTATNLFNANSNLVWKSMQTSFGQKLNTNNAVAHGLTLYGNIGIGQPPNTYALTVADASTDGITGRFNQSSASGSAFAIFATAVGASAQNIGGFFSASGATANHGLFINAPTAAPNNYAVYVNASAKSYFEGSIGLGAASPTAVLHIKAGTAAANTAPIKFTSGPLLTTAEAGAVEFLTDTFYGTVTTGAARQTFVTLERDNAFTGNLSISAGKTLSMASGANKRAGNAVLVAGTIAISNTSVTANTIVMLTRKTAGGTIGDLTYTLSSGTSFTVNSANAADTSTVSYLLVENP